MYRSIIKRVLDFLVSILLLLLFSPILSIITLILLITTKSNPLYFQKRPGKNNQIFTIIKFKTMNNNRDENGFLLPDTERITKIGGVIRKTSVDEVLQLINVIVGDMSIIGPRPLLIKYLPYYTQEEIKRHSVRPGITGLAQISGRNYLDWDNRLRKDIEYVSNISFLNDLKILVKTVINVINAKDVATDTYSENLPDFDVYRENVCDS